MKWLTHLITMLFTLVNANTHYKSTNDTALITFGGRKRSGVVNKAGFADLANTSIIFLGHFHQFSGPFSSNLWGIFIICLALAALTTTLQVFNFLHPFSRAARCQYFPWVLGQSVQSTSHQQGFPLTKTAEVVTNLNQKQTTFIVVDIWIINVHTSNRNSLWII